MSERKPISKKLRFEVFKRDSFKCQYCGRSAPEVLLEVDHIKPVADGGKNNIYNLITACRDCNRGKGKRKLSENAELVKQKEELDNLNERRIQMQMMLEWRVELEHFESEQIDIISNIICNSGRTLTDYGRAKIKMLIKKYGFDEVLISTEIARDKYISQGFSVAFDKIGGICYNRANVKGAKEWV